ncbi:putative exported protein, partial [Yersinia pestis PY-06]
MNGEDRRPRQG